MKYQINTSNYHTFSTFEVNKLSARSYFIPYPDHTKTDTIAPKQKHYGSSKVRCLNGGWDFKFYPLPAELLESLDTDKVSFDKIDVPACWQFRGCDRPFYVTVTDTYEGVEGGILVTSILHCVSGGGIVPRFGKSFWLDEVFDKVCYTGRCGESYNDMKDQFPINTVECTVADMTEPNIRPQESGNRMDCTAVSVSDGKTKVIFEAVDKPFELGIKPYADKALCDMKHRKDEVRTGTYVTFQVFQQGIGTGSCGSNIMP